MGHGRLEATRVWLAVLAALAVALVPALPAQATPTPTPIPADAPWLSVVNYYRAMSGLAPVVENATWSAGARAHSCYMLLNGISHHEVPGLPGYSQAGHDAGMSGNVAVTSAINPVPRRHIELWMTGPFHAIGVLRHQLTQVGYGQCDQEIANPFRSGATLDVLRGLDHSKPRPSWPVLFPGDGTTTSLSRFVTESPNPLTFCNWPSGGGLPVVALMPENFTWATSTITGPSGPLETCTLHKGNTTGVASSILGGDHGVIVMPRDPLQPGTYQVTATTSARSVTWSFTVDPNVADAPIVPAANTSVVGPPSGFVPVSPARIVDTRINLGASQLQPGTPRVIQVAGLAAVPGDATAVSANFTAIGSHEAGYVTVYPCGGNPPNVSTVNFQAHEIVPNAAIVPLDPSGRLCAVSNARVHLLIDVHGAFGPSAPGSYQPVDPSRLFDTRTGHRAPGRLAARGTFSVNVRGVGTGVPEGATAVALNLAAHRPSALSFVTAWPCDIDRPTVSNLNPAAGETRPNLVIVPIPADGRVCFYSESATDLFADLAGYVVNDLDGNRFSPLAPTRFTDTRDRFQTALHAGMTGNRVKGGHALTIAMGGVRGIPTDAVALSVNITTVGALGGGFVTAYPCTPQVPFASTVNLQPGRAVPNAATVKLSPSGALCVYASHDVHVVVDINGYWS